MRRARWWPGAVAAVVFCLPLLAVAERPGDANCNGQIGADDVYVAAADLFVPPPLPCLSADVNGDARATAADVVGAVSFVVAPPAAGPVVSYLGLAGADGGALSPSGTVNGLPVFTRSAGQGFKLVIEGRPGSNHISVGQRIANSDQLSPDLRPDVWVESSVALGDGSLAVCDGGVPAIHPPDFGRSQRISNALNDLSCNFAVATSGRFACTQDRFGTPALLGEQSELQFCMQVTRTIAFPEGETLLTVALRDTVGTLGPLSQILIRVGAGPFPPTSTPTRTPTSTLPPVPPTLTPTVTPSPSFTIRLSATRTSTRTNTATPPFTPTFTLTSAPTASPTATPVTPTPTPTGSPTNTPLPTLTATGPQAPSPTPSPSLTPSRTFTVAATATASRTSSRTNTPTRTPTPSATRTASRTATRSPTSAPGPVVSFFGLTRSDDVLIDPSFTTPEGIPVFVRPLGFGFSIVVEARRGAAGREVGRDTFVSTLEALPDLQIVASNPLGDGSDVVCDNSGASAGGVPGIDPPNFSPTEANIATINDLGCRFVDGTGDFKGRSPMDACTQVPPDNDYGFVSVSSAIQFCATVVRAMEFPPGDTLLSARVLDQDAIDAPPGSGAPGPVAQIIVRVGDANPPSVTPTDSPGPTATRTNSPTRSATAAVTPTRTPTTGLTPTRTATTGVTPTRTATTGTTPTRTPTLTATTGNPATPTRTPTRTATSGGSGTTTPTRTASRTPTRTMTRTRTATQSPTPTTMVDRLGPAITYFGVARFEGTLLNPIGTTPEGIPIFARPVGAGFTVVVEGGKGAANRPIGASSYATDGFSSPDLQIIALRPLGDGSATVCDAMPPEAGGVPGVDPADLDLAGPGVLNDFGCRFVNGQGEPLGRNAGEGCVLFESGGFGFANPVSQLQFCAEIGRSMEFPTGDTLLVVRLRDVDGNIGPDARIVVRIGN